MEKTGKKVNTLDKLSGLSEDLDLYIAPLNPRKNAPICGESLIPKRASLQGFSSEGLTRQLSHEIFSQSGRKNFLNKS